MKSNAELKDKLIGYLDHAIIVEGKKDAATLEALGFEHVYMINQTSVSIGERVEQIVARVGKKRKICILTDFDKKGKQLYLLLKRLFQEQGSRLDSSLRGILLHAGVSHIEGLDSFIERLN
jgi:5S rRNA maturation endonuclease (ribonuclease M5)